MLNTLDSTSQSEEWGVEFDFAGEIAVEILSRLPATDVVRLRSVCRSWRDLTWSHKFMLLHLQRCLPMVLSQKECIKDSGLSCGYDHYLFDQWWEPLQTIPKVYQFGKVSEFRLLFSHGGLVVMNHRLHKEVYMIMNPTYHERVRITLSEEFRRTEIYGVFFHPSLKEYCTLWRITVSGEFTEYKILTLGYKPCWRDINNPWSHRAKIWSMLPVLIDEHLYWLVEPEVGYKIGRSFPADIMQFDIRREEFTFISSPVPGPWTCNEYNINLLDIGGLLSLVRTSPEDHPINKTFEVSIWILKDRTRHLWTMSSYSINADPFWGYRRPMALVNDELVLHDCRQLFSCNLKLRTPRKLYGKRYNAVFLQPHVMSLVSLRNCKSKIYMDKMGEVDNNRKKRRRMRVMLDKNPSTDE